MKKILLILAMAAAVVACNSGNRCVVEGKVLGIEDDTVTLCEPQRGGKVLAETQMQNGEFRFVLEDAEPQLCAVRVGEDMVAMLFTERGTVRVNADSATDIVTIEGTPANEAYSTFNAEMTRINQNYAQAADDAARAAIRGEYDQMLNKAIDENLDNIFGVNLLLEVKGYELSAAEMKAKLSALEGEVAELQIVKDALARAERKMRTEPQVEGSDIVPIYIDIEQPDVNGNNVSLKSVVEKEGNRYVLLDFWASWCGPCMGEMPYLREAYKKYHGKGFEIFGVSFDKKAEAWKGAMKRQEMTWVNVSTLEGFGGTAGEDYVVESIPTNFLIDCSTGIIIAKNLRGEEVEARLAELLK
ncbi:MAG: AhpC/TSA family protein [Alistipes sp.]|nr:AhpC/TSA family protein [Alistipes sp.]